MKPSQILRKKLSFSDPELRKYASTCPYRYKRYQIPKRNGEPRDIAQPSKDLKIVQRILMDEILLRGLPVHRNATAYKKGASILKNSTFHLKHGYLLKLDFREFFPSIKSLDFEKLLVKRGILRRDEDFELKILSQIFFMRDGDDMVLSVGSPGSPLISNALLHDFDERISLLANRSDIAYSRYSDDLTFSTNAEGVLFSWPEKVERELSELGSPCLTINHDKTVFSSKAHNRHVTGITISNDGEASLGRKRKRAIRTKVFLAGTGALSKEEIISLKGLISFASDVEKEFVARLWRKYPVQMKMILD